MQVCRGTDSAIGEVAELGKKRIHAQFEFDRELPAFEFSIASHTHALMRASGMPAPVRFSSVRHAPSMFEHKPRTNPETPTR
jgi:hypothetical protein